MRTRMCGALLVVAVLVMSAGLVWAQGQIELQFDDQPLGVALRVLQQQYGITYSLPANLANTRVTVRQTVGSAALAVQALAKAANVRAMRDPNTGAYMFQAQGAAGSGAAGGSRPSTNPWGGAPTASAPTPWRPGQPAVPGAVPGVPTGAMAPGAAGAALAPGQIMTSGGTVLDLKDLNLRVLETTYINPELVAMLFGGQAIYDISSSGGGGYGGGGYGDSGGYNNNNNNSNDRFGNQSNRSNNSGSSFGSGRSNRSSNIGSGRTY